MTKYKKTCGAQMAQVASWGAYNQRRNGCPHPAKYTIYTDSGAFVAFVCGVHKLNYGKFPGFRVLNGAEG